MRQTRQWNKNHLDVFKKRMAKPTAVNGGGEGKYPRVFGDGLKGVDIEKLPKNKLNRYDVFKFADANSKDNPLEVCVVILAWGGMHGQWRKDFFDLADKGWLDVVKGIQSGKLSREEAYDKFTDLKQRKMLKGVGPAYFTKLIYFLTPRDDRKDIKHGYIMDQWAACSINLLLYNEDIKMNVTRSWGKNDTGPQYNFTVSDANTGADYEKFCDAIDDLREKFDLDLYEVDLALVSRGGKEEKKGDWRKYVIENRIPLLLEQTKNEV